MTYQRLAYDDASTTSEMSTDCLAVEVALHIPRQVSQAARSAFDVFPVDRLPAPPVAVKRFQVAVSDAAAMFAGRLFD